MTHGRGRYSLTDAAMVQLVRLIIDDAWTAVGAAAQLRERVPDDAVLRRVHAKVSSALVERASSVGERAAATLELALSLDPPRRPRPPADYQLGDGPAAGGVQRAAAALATVDFEAKQ